MNVAQVLKKQIISMSPQQLIKMPIAWFGLSFSKGLSYDGVLSLVECQVSAKTFTFKEGMYMLALGVLPLIHHLSTNVIRSGILQYIISI